MSGTQTVLITGASSGIGKAAAELFRARGWNVAATMRTPKQAGEIRLDVTDPVSVRDAIAEAVARHGGVDVVVNNAGYGLVGPFEATTPEQVERQIATNLGGVMTVTRAILPHFRQRRAGVIVNVASMGGRIAFPLYSAYHATKWGVEGFTESLQFELRPLGIRVKIVEPGPVKTDFYDRSMDVIRLNGSRDYSDLVQRAMPRMQKAGATGATAERVARVVYRAATDRSWKLRYSANSAAILALRKLLPDAAFNAVVRAAILR